MGSKLVGVALIAALGIWITTVESVWALDPLSNTERAALQSRLEALGYSGTPVDRQDLLEEHAQLLLESCGLPADLVLEDRPDLLFAVLDHEIDRRKKPPVSSLYVPSGFGRSASAVRFSADGKYLGLFGAGRLAVFDTRNGKEIASLGDASDNFSFVSNSQRIVASLYGRLIWHDFASGAAVRTVDVLRWNLWSVSAIAAHPDSTRWIAAVVNVDNEGHRIALVDGAGQGAVRTIDVVKHPIQRFGAFNPTLAFSPRGDRLAYATTKLFIVWDLATGKQLTFRTLDTNDERDAPKLVFSADGNRVSVLAGKTRQIFGEIALDGSGDSLRIGRTKGIARVSDGRSVFLTEAELARAREGTRDQIPSGLFSSDEVLDSSNGLALARSHNRYFLWALDRLQVRPVTTTQQIILAARYDKARRTVVAVDRLGLVEIPLDGSKPRRVREFGTMPEVDTGNAAATFLDDRLLILRSNSTRSIYLIDVEAWRLLWAQEEPSSPGILDPTFWAKIEPGTFRAFRRGSYSSWIGFRDYELTSGAIIREFAGTMPYKATSGYFLTPVAINHGRYVATTDDNRIVYVIDTATGAVVKTLDPNVPVSAIHPYRPPETGSRPKGHYTLTPFFVAGGRYLVLLAGDQRGRGRLRYFIYETDGFNFVADMSWPQYLSWLNPIEAQSKIIWSNHTVLRFDAERSRIAMIYPGAIGTALLAADDPDADRVVALSREGAMMVWNRSSGSALSTTVWGDEGWLTMIPEGFYSGEGEILSQIGLRLPSTDLLTADRLRRVMLRPDLVKAKLRGDPDRVVEQAAVRLDLSRLTGADAAPTLSIAGHNDARGNLHAELTVSDRGYGIGRIEWRRNGALVAIDKAPAGSTDQITFARDLELAPGSNKIEAIAFDSTDLIASEPASLTAVAPPIFDRPAKLFVLAVGVDEYVDPRLRLKFAAIDAQSIAHSFETGARGVYQNVEVTMVLNQDVVEERLASTFANLASRIAPQDIFLLFVAGHGKTLDGRYVFLPADFHYETEASWVIRGIGQDRFETWLSRIRAARALVLFDTCESGSLVGLEQPLSDSRDALARLGETAGRSVITAATDQTPALEGYRGHGVFTWTILQALSEADANGDRFVDVEELARYLARRVPEATLQAFGQRQDPQMRLEGVNFPLIHVLQGDAAIPEHVRDLPPTHLVVRATPVLATSDQSAPRIADLPVGALVRVIETRGAWALVARQGKDLGYVETGALAAVQ